MAFQPVIPSNGLVGWRYLNQTLDRQLSVFSDSPLYKRDTDYFLGEISSIKSAEELVSDRRILRVALGAFGLQDDINNKAFIQKVLEGDASDPRSLANRLADDRYSSLVEAFGFSNINGSRITEPNFAELIVEKFNATQFEVAIGQSDEQMRLALNADRELEELAARSSSDDTKWYLILGNPPLRQVFQTALMLPDSFAQIDIEQQLSTIKDLATTRVGVDTIDQFGNNEFRQRFVEKFLLQSQIRQMNSDLSSQSIALTLLQGFN